MTNGTESKRVYVFRREEDEERFYHGITRIFTTREKAATYAEIVNSISPFSKMTIEEEWVDKMDHIIHQYDLWRDYKNELILALISLDIKFTMDVNYIGQLLFVYNNARHIFRTVYPGNSMKIEIVTIDDDRGGETNILNIEIDYMPKIIESIKEGHIFW